VTRLLFKTPLDKHDILSEPKCRTAQRFAEGKGLPFLSIPIQHFVNWTLNWTVSLPIYKKTPPSFKQII